MILLAFIYPVVGTLLRGQVSLSILSRNTTETTTTTAAATADNTEALAILANQTALITAQNATLVQLEVKLTNITSLVEEAQIKLDTLAVNVSEVEGITGQSKINLASSLGVLADVEATTGTNKEKSEKLQNSTALIRKQVANETEAFKVMETRLATLEQSTKVLSTDAKAVGEKVTKLEKSVQEAMPGGDISDRLTKLTEKITLFDTELKKGIDTRAKEDLEKLVNKVRDQVKSLGGKMQQGEWMPTPLEDYQKPPEDKPTSTLNEDDDE